MYQGSLWVATVDNMSSGVCLQDGFCQHRWLGDVLPNVKKHIVVNGRDIRLL